MVGILNAMFCASASQPDVSVAYTMTFHRSFFLIVVFSKSINLWIALKMECEIPKSIKFGPLSSAWCLLLNFGWIDEKFLQ